MNLLVSDPPGSATCKRSAMLIPLQSRGGVIDDRYWSRPFPPDLSHVSTAVPACGHCGQFDGSPGWREAERQAISRTSHLLQRLRDSLGL